ncbi:MAG: dipeptidase [Deltaproteobacteria bacterium]|nr:dipeptidase [Deltaproteobacteria bacterium]
MGNDKDRDAFHKELIVIDALNVSNWSEEVFKDIQKGGVTAVNATVAIWENFKDTMKLLIEWNERFEKFEDTIFQVRSTADILKAKETGKVGIILGFQNTAPIEEELGFLQIFYQLGIRIIQLVYMQQNFIGGGCLEEKDSGLSKFGVEVVEEMNRLGILIDLSHVGNQTCRDAIEASEKPVCFTHANPFSLFAHPRNKSDDLLKAIAAKGGVVGANLIPSFLKSGVKSTLDDFVDVIDYLVNLIGIDHVGIGTDFPIEQPESFYDRIVTGSCKRKGLGIKFPFPMVLPEGIRMPSEFPNITNSLARRGYDDESIRKVMGQNFLRLFDEIWV